LKVAIFAALALASTLCLAQAPAPAEPDAKPAAATVAEIQQQIKTLVATRQVYYERLEKITEFQKFTEADAAINEMRSQLQRTEQANAHPGKSRAEQKAADKATEDDFKKKMAANVEREKAADAAKK
jgi:hypothetical protein